MQELKRCHASLAAGDRAELAQMLITLWELIAVRCTSPPSSVIQRMCEDLKQELWGGHQSPPLPIHSAAIFPPRFCQRTEMTWLERQNIPPCAAHLFPCQTAWGGRVISMTEQRTLVSLQSQGDHGVALVGCLHSALPPKIAAGP